MRIAFWLSGQQYHSADGEIVCPAWMVPPTDVEQPTLIVGQDEPSKFTAFEFGGYKMFYQKTFLKFNDDPNTPVVVKKLANKLYAILVREHLLLESRAGSVLKGSRRF